MRSVRIALLAAALLFLPVGLRAQYVNFEGHQIHPLEITPDGAKLLAVNTPDARLSIFSIGVAGDLTLVKEVPVGVEPVSVRARSSTEAWVVNHVSDSISIVDLTPGQERVRQTLSVRNGPAASACTGAGVPFDCCTGSNAAKNCEGDEPTDVVFAGGGGDPRAFVCLSQRNRVDVYAATAPAAPLFFLQVDGEDPRALARNGAGTEVYAAVFHSGNQTTIVSGEGPGSRVTDSSSPYGGAIVPPPAGYNGASSPFNDRPVTSIIVKWRNCTGSAASEWCDDRNSSWNNLLDTTPGGAGGGTVMQMRDRDVAIIDADAATPSVTGYVQSAGTLNFGIAVNPSTQRLYVSNTDARNHVRFESSLEILGDAQGDEDGACEGAEPCTVSLDGHLVDTRITVASGTAVDGFVNLNPHIDYGADIATVDGALSIGQPNGMAFNAGGTRLYAAAILSRKVAVVDTGALPGTLLARIDVGEGPTGVALKESANRLYVLNRHENTISVVNTSTNAEELPRVALFNPEPPEIKDGRKFLYDGALTSGRGDVACATCHAFGDLDLLAWDLGDPTDTFPYDPRPAQPASGFPGDCGANPNASGCGPFHPLKGPQTTQTLRDLGGTEPLHWRGDRANFQAFNPAFPGLLKRRTGQLPAGDMDAFTDFIMAVKFPPNPNRNLDDTLTAGAQSGQNDFVSVLRDANVRTCNQCHALPTGTNGRFINANADGTNQAVKTPQLRNMYEKTGFGLLPPASFAAPAFMRNGFGLVHDGIVDSLFTFVSAPVFTFGSDNTAKNNMVDFMNQFPTGQAATVGFAITFNGANNNDATLNAQLGALLSVLNQGKIDLVVRGVFGGIPRSFRCVTVSPTQASCNPDRQSESPLDAATLKGLAASGAELTFMAVPVGFGQRMGLDRDLDGFRDQDEIDAGSNPADPGSTPGGAAAIPALSAPGAAALIAAFAALALRRIRSKGR
jgi:DNA-binding beta-propeller fold protein YncE